MSPTTNTNKLLEGGENRILKKVAEEIAGEAADLNFHLQVALGPPRGDWRRVQEVLAERLGGPRRD